MKRLLAIMLAGVLAFTCTAVSLAEMNAAEKNAELFKQEKLYDKDARSYEEDHFDLSGYQTYQPKQTVQGWLEIWGHSALSQGNLAQLWAEGFKAYHPDANITYNLPGKEVMLSPLYYDKADIVVVEEPGFYDIMPYERLNNSQPLEIQPYRGSAEMSGYQAAYRIIVNKDFPLDALSMEQLDGIFGAARGGGWIGTSYNIGLARGAEDNIRTWDQVGLDGDYAGVKIAVHSYSVRDPQGETLADLIIGGSDYWVEGMHTYGPYYDEDGQPVSIEQQVVAAVAADKFAIGAVSGSYYLTDDVKTLSITPAGGTAPVAITPDTVSDGTYPLARSGEMFIKVNAKLDDLTAEFLRYILSAEGQAAIVQDGKFVPLSAADCEEQLAIVEAASVISQEGNALSDEDKAAALRTQQAHNDTIRARADRIEYGPDEFDISDLPEYVPESYPEGYIRIAGNNYIETGHLMKYWTEGFQKYHPNIKIAWELPSSSMGYSSIYLDVFDLFLSQPRGLGDTIAYQKIVGEDLWGVQAYSGAYKLGGWYNTLVVEVNENNPIESITMEQLDGIFGAAHVGGWNNGYWDNSIVRGEDKNIRTWGDLGLTGEWADKPITPYTFQLRYNTAREVAGHIMNGCENWNENTRSTGNYMPLEGKRVTGAQWVVENLVDDLYGIGVSRYTDDYMLPGIKFLPVAPAEGEEPVYPDLQTTRNRDYPMVDYQNFYYKVEEGVPMNEMCYEFLKYVLSKEGQEAVIQDAKYQPLTAELVEEMRNSLEAVRYGF